jgi:hypothetical protein
MFASAKISEHICLRIRIALHPVMQTTNSEETSNANHWIYLPLFQLYWFLTSTSPLGLKGPFSENAPTPKEEQPGPANKIPDIQNPNRPKCLSLLQGKLRW